MRAASRTDTGQRGLGRTSPTNAAADLPYVSTGFSPLRCRSPSGRRAIWRGWSSGPDFSSLDLRAAADSCRTTPPEPRCYPTYMAYYRLQRADLLSGEPASLEAPGGGLAALMRAGGAYLFGAELGIQLLTFRTASMHDGMVLYSRLGETIRSSNRHAAIPRRLYIVAPEQLRCRRIGLVELAMRTAGVPRQRWRPVHLTRRWRGNGQASCPAPPHQVVFGDHRPAAARPPGFPLRHRDPCTVGRFDRGSAQKDGCLIPPCSAVAPLDHKFLRHAGLVPVNLQATEPSTPRFARTGPAGFDPAGTTTSGICRNPGKPHSRHEYRIPGGISAGVSTSTRSEVRNATGRDAGLSRYPQIRRREVVPAWHAVETWAPNG